MARGDDGRGAGPVGRIGKTAVEAIPRPPAGRRTALWDAEIKGFGVRMTSNGVRTYVLRYRMGGRDAPQRYLTIGRHGPAMTAEQARRRACELLLSVRLGVDPAHERRKARVDAAAVAARRVDRLFEKLADEWLDGHVRGRLRSADDIEGVVRRDLKPAFAGLTVDGITKSVVAAALKSIGERSEAAANKAHKWLRQMFNWFIEKGVVEQSPLTRMPRPFPEPSRSRVLSLIEITVVWAAAGSLSPPFRDYYRALILLGQRLREVSDLPWSEIDLEGGEWTLPAVRAKNDRDHLVPLSDQAVDLLKIRAAGRRRPIGPIFTTNGEVGLAGFSKMKEALDAAVVELIEAEPEVSAVLNGAVGDWVVHDLRRSLATGCQALGIPLEVTEAVLNHISGSRGGLRRVYQLYDYYEEKADALARWGALIAKAVALWDQRDLDGIVDLDPVASARRRRRAARSVSVQVDTRS